MPIRCTKPSLIVVYFSFLYLCIQLIQTYINPDQQTLIKVMGMPTIVHFRSSAARIFISSAGDYRYNTTVVDINSSTEAMPTSLLARAISVANGKLEFSPST